MCVCKDERRREGELDMKQAQCVCVLGFVERACHVVAHYTVVSYQGIETRAIFVLGEFRLTARQISIVD